MELLFKSSLQSWGWQAMLGHRNRELSFDSGAIVQEDDAYWAWMFDVGKSVGNLFYQMDFALAWVGRGPQEATVFLNVEIDGHDFHEKTKEQARRDKSRDRAMAKAGILVLRFTGAEVYADVKACTEETWDVLAAAVGRATSGQVVRP